MATLGIRKVSSWPQSPLEANTIYIVNSSATEAEMYITNNTGTITARKLVDTNAVLLTGNQTIEGTKTFSSTISGSINGNAATVTNGVYTTDNQSIAGIKTFTNKIVTSNATAVDSDITVFRTGSNDSAVAKGSNIRLGNTELERYHIMQSNSDGFRLFFYNGSSWLNQLLLNSDGNLLVNTTTPLTGGGRLQVDGSANITGLSRINTSSGDGFGLSIERHNTIGIDNAVLYLKMPTGVSSRYLFRADNNSGSQVLIDGVGALLLGTTGETGGGRLQVNGTVNIATINNATGDFVTHNGNVLTKRTPAQVRADIGAEAVNAGNSKYWSLQSLFAKRPQNADWAQNNSYQLLFSRVIINGLLAQPSIINIKISVRNSTNVNNKLGILRLTFIDANNNQQQRFLEIEGSGTGEMSGEFNIKLKRELQQDNTQFDFRVIGTTTVSKGVQATTNAAFYSEESPFVNQSENTGFTLDIHYSSAVAASSNYGGNTAIIGEIDYAAINEVIFNAI